MKPSHHEPSKDVDQTDATSAIGKTEFGEAHRRKASMEEVNLEEMREK